MTEPTTRARARTGDPWTSHAAAHSVEPTLRESQAHVLKIVEVNGPIALHELVFAFGRIAPVRGWKRQSDSGLRTRLSELVDAGLVRDTGRTTRTPGGRHAKLWEIGGPLMEGATIADDASAHTAPSMSSRGPTPLNEGDGYGSGRSRPTTRGTADVPLSVDGDEAASPSLSSRGPTPAPAANGAVSAPPDAGSSSERPAAQLCDGSRDCSATEHIHGCFAERPGPQLSLTFVAPICEEAA